MMNRRRFEGIEPFPFTFTIAWVVGIFAISPAPLADLWRPLFIALALAAVWIFTAALIRPRGRWFAIAAASAWLLALTAWWVAAIVPALIAVRAVLVHYRRRRGKQDPVEPASRWVARMANTLGVSLCFAAAVGAVRGGVLHIPMDTGPSSTATQAGPNFYVLLLDGYPRHDTLGEEFGFRNEPFFEELDRRGFDVAEESRANYNTTVLTLASSLHMSYLHDIRTLSGDAGDPVSQVRRVTAAINGAPVPAILRGAGYRIVGIPSWYGEAALTSADEMHRSGHITLFEEQLLRLGTLGKLLLTADPDFVADQQRENVRFVLSKVGALATSGGPPTFILAHVFSPHAPLLFHADGSPQAAPACYPQRCSFNITEASALGLTLEEYGEALSGNLEYLNREIVATVDDIIATDPEAVIVLFSDHGARYGDEIGDEHFRTFFAARTPGHPGLFGENASPVNLFSRVFNAYLGTSLPMRPYRAWAADPGAPLELVPVH